MTYVERSAWGFVALLSMGILWVEAGQSSSPTDAEKLFLDLINREREKKELAPLAFHPVLVRVARQHSENMAKHGITEHQLDGKNAFERLSGSGYRFAKGGENIASMDLSINEKDLVKRWLASPEHSENILQPTFSETGVGFARDAKGRTYVTQVFAKPQIPPR